MEKIFIKQRDIILVPFPFSDQSGKKVRPALIVSNNNFNSSSSDVIICAITTNVSKDFYNVNISLDSLEGKNIHEVCCVKTENILKIDKKLVIKIIDRLKVDTFEKVKNKLLSLF